MKKAGLLGGMSWESTVTYYQIINERVREKLGGSSSADMIIRSLDLEVIENTKAVADGVLWQIFCAMLQQSLNECGGWIHRHGVEYRTSCVS